MDQFVHDGAVAQSEKETEPVCGSDETLQSAAGVQTSLCCVQGQYEDILSETFMRIYIQRLIWPLVLAPQVICSHIYQILLVIVCLD